MKRQSVSIWLISFAYVVAGSHFYPYVECIETDQHVYGRCLLRSFINFFRKVSFTFIGLFSLSSKSTIHYMRKRDDSFIHSNFYRCVTVDTFTSVPPFPVYVYIVCCHFIFELRIVLQRHEKKTLFYLNLKFSKEKNAILPLPLPLCCGFDSVIGTFF